MTACANPGCDNPLPAPNHTGRPAIYCSPACRKRRRHPPAGKSDDSVGDAIVVELDHPATSTDGRPPQRIWTLRLRRRQHSVTIAEGLGWPTANALAQQLRHLLDDTAPTSN